MPAQYATKWSVSSAAGEGHSAWTALQSAGITTDDWLEKRPVRTCQNWYAESNER